MTMTENWLSTSNDTQVLPELLPLGYDILQMARSDKRLDDVVVLFKEGLGGKVVHLLKDVIYLPILNTYGAL